MDHGSRPLLPSVGAFVFLRRQITNPGGRYRVTRVTPKVIKVKRGSDEAVELSHHHFFMLLDEPRSNAPDEGVLRASGYCVGEKDIQADQRRTILEQLVYRASSELPDLPTVPLWGEPGSPKRLTKMADTIWNLAEAHRSILSWRTAVADWDDDLEWLRRRFAKEIDASWPVVDLAELTNRPTIG
jgi:hypothetical protein